jgi:TonB family protein
MSAHLKAIEEPFRPPEKPAAGTPSAPYRTGTPGAEALCLEVPIRALGSRAFTHPGGEILTCEPFEEESITMLLLPRGAVIRLAAPVARGQDLVLMNKWTNKYVHCRVANIRISPEVKRYVEIEFTHTAPNFWAISFPKEAAKVVTAEFAPETPAAPPTEPCVEAPWVVPEKALAAAAGATPPMAAVVVPALAPERAAAIPPSAAAPQVELDESPSPEPFFLPLATERVPLCEPVLAHMETAPVPPQSMEWDSLSGPTLAQMEAAPVSPPSIKWDSLSEPAPRRSGALRAMVATAVLCAAFLGYRIHSALEQPPLTTLPTASSTDGESVQPAAAATPAAVFAGPAMESRSDAPAAMLPSAGPSAAAAPASTNTVTVLAPEETRVERPGRFVILNSKMTTPVHNATSDPNDLPDLTASTGDEPALAAPQLNGEAPGTPRGLLSATVPGLPPPPPPVPVPENAGDPAAPLTPARVVSSVPPIYPSLAKQAHIEGNVTIEAQIDASGKVAGMKVLSGPLALREAATDALAKWKFQPAQRGNQVTPISVIVTIQFVLR